MMLSGACKEQLGLFALAHQSRVDTIANDVLARSYAAVVLDLMITLRSRQWAE
jgi:hypothetical protein